jgi:formylglycine-generating enzyme
MYPPNGYGLFGMMDNVWEWIADWYSSRHTADKPNASCVQENPRDGAGTVRIPRKVVKGGSDLCAPNYCRPYLLGGRHARPIASGRSHVGFHCVVRT